MAPHASKRQKLTHSTRAFDESLDSEQTDVSESDSNPELSTTNLSGDVENSRDAQSLFTQHTSTATTRQSVSKAVHDEVAAFSQDQATSSMFKLQLDEMLTKLQPSFEQSLNSPDHALRKLKNMIESIGEREPLAFEDAISTLRNEQSIVIPFPDPKPKNPAYKLSYRKPASINVVGSYALKTMIASDDGLSVDLVVSMPASIFQEKDFLNYRYFYKRAYYIACISTGLQGSKEARAFNLKFEYLNGNSLQPIVIVEPATGDNSFLTATQKVRIIPAAPKNFFSTKKLGLLNNCIRQTNATPETGDTPASLPTPFYNSTLSADIAVFPYLKLLHLSMKQCPSFKHACILGRLWLRQRGFTSHESQGGFGAFEWSALMAVLLQGGGAKDSGLLSPAYSSYQLFKAVIQYLTTSNLSTKPFFFRTKDQVTPKSELPVFYDSPRNCNILFKMTAWSYALLRSEAAMTLGALNQGSPNAFDSTFIIKVDHMMHKYDAIVQMAVPVDSISSDFIDHLHPSRRISHQVYSILREGLTNRVKSINLQVPTPRSWLVTDAPPHLSGECQLLAGFVFDPAHIDRAVDHGPSVEKKSESAKYRQFWGEKAELRRFRDGSILESVIWAPRHTGSVFRDIIKYISKQHLNLDVGTKLRFIAGAGDFDGLLSSPNPGADHFKELFEAFKSFERDIRDLEGLPLHLRQLSPICAQLRRTSIDLPQFSPRHPLRTPAEVVLKFEGSGRWPDDIVAIQRTKVAFLIRIGKLLEDGSRNISTRVGLENHDKPLHNCGYLDIIYASGAVFRLRIQNDREETLLERLTKNKTIDATLKEEAIQALSLSRKHFVQLPLHNQSITSHCTRMPLLSSTIRLVKKWFASHMLTDHISDELIELLVVHTFLHHHPWAVPSSTMTGFLRTLRFIAGWDWRTDPLIINFDGSMTNADTLSARTRLQAWRKLDPQMNRTILYVSSNHDKSGICFTNEGPSKVIATRMTTLARAASRAMKERGIELEAKTLFATQTDGYDFVIHLHPHASSVVAQEKVSQFRNLAVSSDNPTITGFDPLLSFIKELKGLYTTNIIFFHDPQKNTIMGGLWNPQTSNRPLRINNTHAVKPMSENTTLVDMDKSAILSEIARLGGDIIARIDLR